jgi:GntR family transcriptional regulator
MRFQIQFNAGKPVYLQLIDQIKAAAASGAIRPGEPLPSIRPLAEELRVNRNTVAKAYAEMENQGIIHTVPGRGCFLAENNSPYKLEIRKKMIEEQVDALVVQAHHLQIEAGLLMELVRKRFEHFASRNQTSGVSSK